MTDDHLVVAETNGAMEPKSEVTSNDDADNNIVWEELMGPDLQIKLICNDDTKPEVQLHDAVRFVFEARLAPTRDEVDDNIVQTNTSSKDNDNDDNGWLITIGSQTVVPALEMGLRFMRSGGEALIWTHSKFALGLCSRQHNVVIPPESNLMYKIKVLQVTPADEISLPISIQLGMYQKLIANDVYANEWTDGAALNRIKYLYNRCAKEAQDLLVALQEEEQQDDDDDEVIIKSINDLAALRLDCLNNLTAALLRAKQYKQAKEAALQVLQLDAHNAKALLRAARASLYDPASTFAEVQAALDAAAVDDANVHDLQKLRRELKQRKIEYNESAKKSMFGKLKNVEKTDKESNSVDTKPKSTPISNADTPALATEDDVASTQSNNSADNTQTSQSNDKSLISKDNQESEIRPPVDMSMRHKFIMKRTLMFMGAQTLVLSIFIYFIKFRPRFAQDEAEL